MTSRIPRVTAAAWFGAWALLAGAAIQSRTALADDSAPDNQVLEWNQVFIDTLIATNTPNSSSQRLGAIVHTAIFDAYNGIERRYRPILVRPGAAPGASRRAAVIAAAHTALVGLFPSRQLELDSSYAASLAALGEDPRIAAYRASTLSLGTRVSAPTRGNRASAVSHGARRSRKQCSRGVRPMALTAATLPSAEGRRSANGGQLRPQPR